MQMLVITYTDDNHAARRYTPNISRRFADVGRHQRHCQKPPVKPISTPMQKVGHAAWRRMIRRRRATRHRRPLMGLELIRCNLHVWRTRTSIPHQTLRPVATGCPSTALGASQLTANSTRKI